MSANVSRLPIDCDLNRSTFAEAVALLRVSPDTVTLFFGPANSCGAYKIHEEYACTVVMVPDELLKNPDIWAVNSSSATVWSCGA